MHLISAQNGNFVDASSWKQVDATSFLDSQAGNTGLTASYVESQAFTPGAITIDGVAIKLNAVAAGTPSNQISIRLAQGGSLVAGTEVTIDVADLFPASNTEDNGGWVFFKFASPVTLLAATAYTLSAKLSATTTAVNLYRDGTAANYSRMLRTTTTQAPIAGDVLHIMEEKTGAGAATAIEINMNETADTDYGLGTDNVVALDISDGGILDWDITPSSTFNLRLSGNLIVYGGGQHIRGSVADPCPITTLHRLRFDPVADGGMGYIVKTGGTSIRKGSPRTTGKEVVQCQLNTDEAIASTSLGVDADTGWLDNDQIVVGKTERSGSIRTERGTLNGNATVDTLPVDGFAGAGGGVAFAHKGVGFVKAYVGLLTHNSLQESVTSTIMTFMNFKAGAIVDWEWTENRYFGATGTGKRGLEVETTAAGNLSITHSSFYECENQALYITGAAVDNIVISENIFDRINTSDNSGINGLSIATGTTGTEIYIEDNLIFRGSASDQNGFFVLNDVGCHVNRNVIVDTTGMAFELRGGGEIGEFDGNKSLFNRNSSTWALQIEANGIYGEINDFEAYWNNGRGMVLNSTVGNQNSGTAVSGLIINDPILFGNGTSNLVFGKALANTEINRMISNSDSTYSTPTGVEISSSAIGVDLYFNDCDFSTVNSTKIAHTDDFSIGDNVYAKIYLNNCKLGGANQITITGALQRGSFIRSHKHNQVETAFKTWKRGGVIENDTSVRHTASGYSWKNTPNSASNKLSFPGTGVEAFKAAVNADTPVTIKAFVRYDSSYNGNMPRLVLKGGVLEGIPSDVVDTAQAANADAWDELSVTATPDENGVVEFLVDGDGTAGNFYVDDFDIVQ